VHLLVEIIEFPAGEFDNVPPVVFGHQVRISLHSPGMSVIVGNESDNMSGVGIWPVADRVHAVTASESATATTILCGFIATRQHP
jgi:hypothetical protein